MRCPPPEAGPSALGRAQPVSRPAGAALPTPAATPGPAASPESRDAYLATEVPDRLSLIWEFDVGRDQPFVEINNFTKTVADVSWVRGCDQPVVTLEPSSFAAPRRVWPPTLLRALQDAVDMLGPRPEETTSSASGSSAPAPDGPDAPPTPAEPSALDPA